MHALYFTIFVLCLFFVQLAHLSTKTYEPPKLRLNRTFEDDESEEFFKEESEEGKDVKEEHERHCPLCDDEQNVNEETLSDNISNVKKSSSHSFWNFLFPFIIEVENKLPIEIRIAANSTKFGPKEDIIPDHSYLNGCGKNPKEKCQKIIDRTNTFSHIRKQYSEINQDMTVDNIYDFLQNGQELKMSKKAHFKKHDVPFRMFEQRYKKLVNKKFYKKCIKKIWRKLNEDSSDEEGLDSSRRKCLKAKSDNKNYKKHRDKKFKNSEESKEDSEGGSKFAGKVFYENGKSTIVDEDKVEDGSEDQGDRPHKRKMSNRNNAEEKIFEWKSRESQESKKKRSKEGRQKKEERKKHDKNFNRNNKDGQEYDDRKRRSSNHKLTDDDDNDYSKNSESKKDYKKEKHDVSDDDRRDKDNSKEFVDDDNDNNNDDDDDDDDGEFDEEIEQDSMDDLSEREDDKKKKKKKRKKKKKKNNDKDATKGDDVTCDDDSDGESSKEGYESNDDDTDNIFDSSNDGDLYIDDDYEDNQW